MYKSCLSRFFAVFRAFSFIMSDVLDGWKLTAFHQTFALPEALVFYIAMNPPSPEVFNKLIQCCKYFWLKNPVITLYGFYDVNKLWETREMNGFQNRPQKIHMENFKEKLWIHFNLDISDQLTQSAASSIVPRIYRCDLYLLRLSHQSLTFDEFQIFTSSAILEELHLRETTVKNDDGSIVPIEQLIEPLPELIEFYYFNVSGDDGLQTITSETAANLNAIPHFHQIESFKMYEIPESFNIDAFFATPKVSNLNCFAIPSVFSHDFN